MNFDHKKAVEEGAAKQEVTVKDLLDQLEQICKETRYELHMIHDALDGEGPTGREMGGECVEPNNFTPPVMVILKNLHDGYLENLKTIVKIREVLW